MIDTSYDEYVQRVPPSSGNGGNKTSVPIIYAELEKRLKPSQREELIRRFSRVKEVPFDIQEHHPILLHYYQLLGTFVDAKPQVSITPLLSAMAANVGNKAFMTVYGERIYCNIWTLIMGPSSIARKSTSVNRTLPPLFDLDDEYEKEYDQQMSEYKKKPEDIRGDPPKERCIILPDTTTERFIEILSVNPNGLLVHNEIASFLSKMNKSYNGDFKFDITNWFDSPERKKKQTMTRKEIIRRPCFSISTASTKDWLLDQMNPKDLQSGFMQRFLVCSAQDIQRDQINCRLESGKQESQHTKNWLARLYAGLRSIGSTQHPKEIELSEEARDLHETVNGEILDTIFQEYSNMLFSYWARTMTGYFVRLCILFTIAEHVEWSHANGVAPSENQQDLIVSEQTAAYVLKLCHFYFQNIRAFIKSEAVEEYNQHEQKILDVFYEHSKDIGKDKIITRKFMNVWTQLRSKDLDNALDQLIDLEVIQEFAFKADGAKRPTKAYKLLL